MNDAKSGLIITLIFSFVPYLLVAWGYTKFTSGNAETFWTAMAVLLITRLLFSVIEFLGSILSWRLYGRKQLVDRVVSWLRINNFPKRYYHHDDFSNYLGRVEEDEAS